jgi:hypothetical protein
VAILRGRLLALGGVAACLLIATPVRAGVAPQAASNVLAVRAAPDGGTLVDVQIAGGGVVTVPVGHVPAGFDPVSLHLTAKRVRDLDSTGPSQAGPPLSAPSATQHVAPVGGSAQFPPAAPDSPGTVVTVGGGNCDGYAALDATISPTRLSYGRDGSIVWVDDDAILTPTTNSTVGVTTGTVFFERGRHLRGSVLIRTLDARGRVHTLGPLLPSEYGRELRQDFWTRSMTQVVADGAGGAYYQKNADMFDISPLHDGPGTTGIWRLRADGRRDLVVGGGPFDHDWGRGFSMTVHDGEAVRGASLAFVQSFTLDPAGNIYFAESYSPAGSNANVVRIRFANLSRAAVTFYRGTPWQLEVAPGTVKSIAAMNQPRVAAAGADETTRGYQPARGDGGPAAAAEMQLVPSLVYREGILYAADHSFRGDGRAANLEIRAVNLGREPDATVLSSRTVNGTPIRNGFIDAVAGNQAVSPGYAGDGIPARSAAFNVENTQLYGDFAVDGSGRIVVADTLNHRIRTVDAQGIIHTVGGTGVAGDDGDRRSAASSRVWGPTGVAIDNHGQPTFADYFNSRIRRLSPSGTLDDVVGRGPSPCGNGQLAAGTDVYSGAYFGQPRAVATDSKGRMYVGDSAYNQIRRIGRDGRIDLVIGRPTRCAISDTFRDPACPGEGPQDGDGGSYAAAGLADPHFLLVDAYDNLYISDVDRVRYVNLSTHPVSVHGQTVAPGAITTIHRFTDRLVTVSFVAPVTGETITTTQRQGVGDLTIDGYGNLFVADPTQGLVYRIGCSGDLLTIVGNGLSGSNQSTGDGGSARSASVMPVGLAYDRAREMLLVLDQRGWYTRVRAVNLGQRPTISFRRSVAPGEIETVAGSSRLDGSALYGDSSGDGGPAFDASLEGSSTLALMPSGRLYLADGIYNSVRVLAPDGRIDTVAGRWPQTSPYDSTFSAPSGYGGDGGPALNAWFGLLPRSAPEQATVARGPGGSLVVVDTHQGRVRLIRDVDHAPVRPAPKQVMLPASDRDKPRFLHDVRLTATRPAALANPDITVTGDQAFVSGAEGEGHGCHVWSVLRRPATSQPAISYLGQAGPAAATPVGASAAVSVGGSSCAAAARGGAVIATPVRTSGDVSVAGRDLGVLVATASGTTWQSTMAGSSDRAGGRDLPAAAVANTGSGLVLAFASAAGDLVVTRSSDGTTFTPVARLAGPVIDVGRLVVSSKGSLVLPIVVSRPGGMTVSLATSADGTTWSTADVATVPSAISTPVSAVDASGEAYVTWSDGRHVVAMASPDRHHWTPMRLAQPRVAVLPSVVARGHGQVAFMFYGSNTPGVTDALGNARTSWSIYSAVVRNAVAARPAVELRRAEEGEVFHGPICVIRDCALAPHLGSPAAALDTRGFLMAAFTSAIPGGETGLSYALSCEPIFAAPGPCSGAVPHPATTEVHVPADVPAVDVPGLAGCSPLPPPFAIEQTPTRQDKPAPPGNSRVVVNPPAVAVPEVAPALPPPAPPGPVTQAQAQSQPEAQSNPQSASQAQSGLAGAAAPGENDQAEVATAGVSGRDADAMAMSLAAGLVLTAAAAYRAREQRMNAVAGVSARRPGRHR